MIDELPSEFKNLHPYSRPEIVFEYPVAGFN